MIEKIYIDLDGVLADFDAWKDEFGKTHPEINTDIQEFWTQAATVDRLYYHLDLMPDASALMMYLESLGIPLAILTAIPRRKSIPSAESDKREWVKENIGDIEFHIGPFAKDKQRFSKPGMVLIDDKQKNIDEWNAKGGDGVVFTSTNRTIKAIEALM